MVILSLNEADRILKCIESVKNFERVLVIDSFSNDGTLDVVRNWWAEQGLEPERLQLMAREWPGYTQARNESLQWVPQGQWVLWADADEVLSAELLQELSAISWEKLNKETIFEIPRLSFFLGQAVRHGGWYPDRKRRLACSGFVRWCGGPANADVHEDLFLKQGEEILQRTESCFYHYPFRDERDQLLTNQRYSKLLGEAKARELIKRGASAPSDLWIVLKSCVKFIENYVFKLGMLDGKVGWKIARGSALSMKWRLQTVQRVIRQQSARGRDS